VKTLVAIYSSFSEDYEIISCVHNNPIFRSVFLFVKVSPSVHFLSDSSLRAVYRNEDVMNSGYVIVIVLSY